MSHVLNMRGSTRPCAVSYEQMLAYHGGHHTAGVAIAYKVLETAFARLSPNEAPERDRIRLVVSATAPGIVDGFEFATRAFSRNRAIFDRTVGKGEASCGGRLYFEVHYKGASVALFVRERTLDPAFVALADKCAGGAATPAEQASFVTARRDLAARVLATPASDLFDIADAVAA